MDNHDVRNLTERLLNPENTTFRIYKAYGIRWTDRHSFSRTLCDLTAYDDYVDLLRTLTPREKNRVIQKVRSMPRTPVLPPRWRYMVDNLSREECARFYHAMDLGKLGLSQSQHWEIMNVECQRHHHAKQERPRPAHADQFATDNNTLPAVEADQDASICTEAKKGRQKRYSTKATRGSSSHSIGPKEDTPVNENYVGSTSADTIESTNIQGPCGLPTPSNHASLENHFCQTPLKTISGEDTFRGDATMDIDDRSSLLDTLSHSPSPMPWPVPNTQAQQGVDSDPSHTPIKPKRRQTGRTSNHFPTPEVKRSRPPAGTSSIMFPPTTAPRFGIVQETLWAEPYKLLVAVIFLNKTKGEHAMPVFRQLMARYPLPHDLARAEMADICDLIRHLGLQTQRARKLIKFATAWIIDPAEAGRRRRTLHYPRLGDGKDIKIGQIEGDAADCAGALEIGHFPGCGPYAWDSWRIFCRDVLRGVATGYNGEGAGAGFEPEWKRVVPLDKELRACLRWMWLREGWVWDPLTGNKHPADEETMRKARAEETEWQVPEPIVLHVPSQDTLAVDNVVAGAADAIAKTGEQILGLTDVPEEVSTPRRPQPVRCSTGSSTADTTPEPVDDDQKSTAIDSRSSRRSPPPVSSQAMDSYIQPGLETSELAAPCSRITACKAAAPCSHRAASNSRCKEQAIHAPRPSSVSTTDLPPLPASAAWDIGYGDFCTSRRDSAWGLYKDAWRSSAQRCTDGGTGSEAATIVIDLPFEPMREEIEEESWEGFSVDGVVQCLDDEDGREEVSAEGSDGMDCKQEMCWVGQDGKIRRSREWTEDEDQDEEEDTSSVSDTSAELI